MGTTEERSSRRPAAVLEPRGPDRVDPAGRLQPAAPPDRGVPGLAAPLDGPQPQGPGPHHTLAPEPNRCGAAPDPSPRRPDRLDRRFHGLKILGCGEWNAHKHKASKKRRDWRKLHIGVDAEGFIVAAELTASSRDDASTLPALLDTIEVPIRRFTADGAYDHRSVYDQLSAAGTENVVIVIPPRRSAVSAGPTDGPWAQRDTALDRIRQVGRREWQKESGYRQQARVENSFFRYKSVLGGGLKARQGTKERSCVSGVTSSTGWPSWVGRNPALWCPEREVGKAPPLAPQLNHATAPLFDEFRYFFVDRGQKRINAELVHASGSMFGDVLEFQKIRLR